MARNRATRGKKGTGMKEEEAIEHFLTCCDRDTILLFSDRGVVYIDPDEGYAYSRLRKRHPIEIVY
jgi:DNA gyrase/topoisomerase IV subunit A